MAHRIRSIKPDIWHSEDVRSLSILGRLVWVILISIADDEGRIKGSARHLAATYIGEVEVDEVQTQLDQMEDNGMVLQYEADGRRLVQIMSWNEHQYVQHPKASRLPPPPGWTSLHDESGNVMKDHEASVHSARGRADRIRSDQIGTDPQRARVRTREGDLPKETETAPDATSGPNGTSDDTEADVLLAGFRALTGIPPSYNDELAARNIVEEFGYRLSASEMVEQMTSYAKACEEKGYPKPRHLNRCVDTIRRAADYKADQAADRPASRTNGQLTSINEILHPAEEDPF